MRRASSDKRQYITVIPPLPAAAVEITGNGEAVLEGAIASTTGSTGDEINNERSGRTISVLLVDDHVLVREGLRRLFELEEDIRVVGEAGNGFEALREARRLLPDVVLMDMHLPLIDGTAVTRQICTEYPSVAVVLLAKSHQPYQVVQAMKNGARGYLFKTASVREVVEAIHVVSGGGTYIEQAVAGAIVDELRRLSVSSCNDQNTGMLSEREIAIVRCVAAGMSNKEIAAHLSYAEKTVKNYLSVIFQKLHVRDRTQVAIFALRQGLLPYEAT
ncbi:MAG: response regulator transcription factor [Ktedonobacteraceae bacterium]|nr:response regulator transcription factor [Ktedonobacteraceae bacterium]